jgi:hypothetical protein
MRWVLALAWVFGLSTAVERVEAFSMGEGLATTGIQGTLAGNASTGVAGITKSVKAALPTPGAGLAGIDDGGSGLAEAARSGPGGKGGAKSSGASQARWSQGGNSWATGSWAAGGGRGSGGSWAQGGSWGAGSGWATAGSPKTARR